MTLAATSSTRRLSTTILVTGFTLASLLTSGVKATAASTGDVPAAAVARLTALGFSDDEAAGLLRATRIRPASTGGAYAAQRIAMATLYGSADAFGGPRYRRPSS